MTISVVIPAFNAEATLGQTLASVVGQTHQPDEVIVVDDASADATIEVARSFEDLLPIRVIERKENCGVGPARGSGLDAATCDAIAFIDSDDLWFPFHLHELNRIYTGPGSIAAAQYLSWMPGLPLDVAPSSKVITVPPADAQPLVILEGAFLSIGAMFSRDDYRVTEGYQAYDTGEDWDMWIQLISNGARVVQCHVPSVLYRQRPGSLTTDVEGMLRRDIEILERHLPKLDGRALRRARSTIRRREARIELVAAIKTAADGRPNKARMMHLKAALRDHSLRRFGQEFNSSVTARAMLGLVQPARGAVGLADGSESELADAAEVAEPKPDRRVSIVVVADDHESMLEATLAGLLTLNLCTDGSFPAAEVIVVDRSSSGRGNEIVERFEGHLPVRMVSLDEDADEFEARSAGLEAATSELTLFVDSGDVVLPDHLDLLLAEYEPGRMVAARAASWTLAGEDTQSLTPAENLKTSATVLPAETVLESDVLFNGALVSTERLDAAGLSVLCRVLRSDGQRPGTVPPSTV